MNKAREDAKKFFQSLTREELIEVLKDAGFEVSDGSGEIIFTDDIE